MKTGSDVDADVAKTAIAATEGAIKAAAKAGTDISGATKGAVSGAIKAGDEIGTHARIWVTPTSWLRPSSANPENIDFTLPGFFT